MSCINVSPCYACCLSSTTQLIYHRKIIITKINYKRQGLILYKLIKI